MHEVDTTRPVPAPPATERSIELPLPETETGNTDSENDSYFLMSRIRDALLKNDQVGSDQAGQLIAMAPESSYSRFLAGSIYLRNSETENARQQFIRAAELDPANEHALTALGGIAQNAGDLSQADLYYSKAYEAAPSPETANRLALLRIKGGYVESAKNILANTLAEYPEDPMTRNNLAIALDIQGTGSIAIDLIDDTGNMDPRLLSTRALLHLKGGRPDQAKLDLENVSGTDLSNGRSLLMGIADLQLGELDSAQDRFRSVISSNPSDHEGYMNLGLALRRQGKFTEAEKVYQQGLKMASHPDLHLNLGVLYELYHGKPAMALMQYRKYLEMEGPASDRVKEWVAYLEGVVERQ